MPRKPRLHALGVSAPHLSSSSCRLVEACHYRVAPPSSSALRERKTEGIQFLRRAFVYDCLNSSCGKSAGCRRTDCFTRSRLGQLTRFLNPFVERNAAPESVERAKSQPPSTTAELELVRCDGWDGRALAIGRVE